MKVVSVVTGANKGIGFEIARGLLRPNSCIIVACRNVDLGIKARDILAEGKPDDCEIVFHELDISNPQSIVSFVAAITRAYGKVDLLVNNAAIAFKNSDPTPFKDQASPTLKTNYFGTVSLTRQLLPLMNSGARIVNIASMAGHLKILPPAAGKVRGLLTSPTLSEEQLDDVVHEFVKDIASGDATRQGAWPASNYGMSKLAIIAWTKILARLKPDLIINSVCPGWCSTDMSSHSGPRSAAKGAETPLMLSLNPSLTLSGGFWTDLQEIVW